MSFKISSKSLLIIPLPLLVIWKIKQIEAEAEDEAKQIKVTVNYKVEIVN